MKKEANTKIEDQIVIAEQKFDAIQKQLRAIEIEEKKLAEKKVQLNVESFRLQGEHRALKALLGDNPEQDPEQLSDKQKDDGNI